MEIRDRGVSAALVSRGPVCALVAATLAAATMSPAVLAASQEAGQYSFEAFVPAVEDPRLPAELRATALPSPRPVDLLTTDRAVEIKWVGRERPGLRGYRLTATIDGGPLSGLAARWTVAPGSGERGLLLGPRLYRFLLPIPVDGRLRLHAALEALLEDGSAVLLAVRHSTPARATEDRWLSGPIWHDALPSSTGKSAVLPPVGAAQVSSREAGLPDLRSARLPSERRAVFSAEPSGPGRPRGPPAVAC